MKQFITVLRIAILVLFCAGIAQAQMTTTRFVFLTNYLTASEAGSAVASGANQPLFTTGSSSVPYVSWTIFYCTSGTTCDPETGTCHIISCSILAPPPPPIPVNWLEFTSADFNVYTTGAKCTPSAMHPPFTSLSACASWWYDRIKPYYQHVGRATSTEATEFFYYFND